MPESAIDALLPHEWPGSHCLGQEEIDTATKAIEDAAQSNGGAHRWRPRRGLGVGA